MLEISSVKKFTRNRDDLIKILDKVKFILDNGYDVKIDNGKTYKSTFTTPIDFYSSVKPCIDYINEEDSIIEPVVHIEWDFDNMFDLIKTSLAYLMSLLIKSWN